MSRQESEQSVLRVGDTPADPARHGALPTHLVIIPVRHAERTLLRCLAALRSSAASGSVRILIVRDGEDPQPALTSAEEIRSPTLGSAAAARNAGARTFPAGILVFVDSDVVLDPQALRALLEPIETGRAEATVGNYSLSVAGLSFLQGYKQLYIATIYGRRRGYIEREFWTAIGAVRADVFHRLGGFDPAFRGACGEDTELGYRLTAAGARILFVPAATGQHLHNFTLPGLVRNDLRKGRQMMLNALRYRKLVSGNRHSTPSDILAVAAACLIGVPLLASIVLPLVSVLVATAIFFVAWLVARRDMLKVYRAQNFTFILRAIPLALLLDWVRAVCVATALIQFACERALPPGHPRRSS